MCVFCMCVSDGGKGGGKKDRQAEEGRLEPRLRSAQLTGNTTVLSGSASHSERRNHLCGTGSVSRR